MVPHFNTYSNWREVRIVSHSDSNSGPSTSSNQNSVPRSHPWDPNVTIRSAENINYTEGRLFFVVILLISKFINYFSLFSS